MSFSRPSSGLEFGFNPRKKSRSQWNPSLNFGDPFLQIVIKKSDYFKISDQSNWSKFDDPISFFSLAFQQSNMQATNEFNEKMNEIKYSIERTLENIKSYNEKIRQETNYLTFLMAWQKDLEDADKLKNESQSPPTISKLNTRISSYELKLNMTENLVKFQSSLLTKTNKFGFKIIF